MRSLYETTYISGNSFIRIEAKHPVELQLLARRLQQKSAMSPLGSSACLAVSFPQSLRYNQRDAWISAENLPRSVRTRMIVGHYRIDVLADVVQRVSEYKRFIANEGYSDQKVPLIQRLLLQAMICSPARSCQLLVPGQGLPGPEEARANVLSRQDSGREALVDLHGDHFPERRWVEEQEIPMSSEPEFGVLDPVRIRVVDIAIAKEHDAGVPEVTEELEQALALRRDALEPDNREKLVDQAPRSLEHTQLVTFHIALDEGMFEMPSIASSVVSGTSMAWLSGLRLSGWREALPSPMR